jgi:hypothetical protein
MYFSHWMNIVAYFPKPKIEEPEKSTLLGNGCVTGNNRITVGNGIFYSVRTNSDAMAP